MIGERLKELRKDKGLSQQKLSEILGFTKSAVSLYEKNRSEPNDKIKIMIAKYFNISVDYLIVVNHS